MSNRITNEKKRLSEALRLHPEIKVLKYLGGGNKGEAYLLEDGKVLKITIDKEEYSTAMILRNRRLSHIINFYEGWSFDCNYDEEYSDNLFAIIEEYVDTTWKKDIAIKFVSAFKHAWFSIYFYDIEQRQSATFDDLNEYMRHPQEYFDAIDFTKQYILNEGEKYNQKDEFGNMYIQLACAYVELYQNAPNAHLDLNDGNIGFTSDGVLKIFDIQ
jgi:hypothetical protein